MNYTLHYLKMRNCGPYQEECCIEFRHGLTFLVGRNHDSRKSDSNGSGKSSILYALPLCWWGKSPEGTGIKDAINHSGGELRLETKLVSPEQDLIITRTATHRTHTLEVEILHPTEPRFLSGDLRTIQQELNLLLGCDFGLFCSCLYLSESSYSTQFLFAKPAERASILSHLIDDSSFQTGAEIATQKAQQARLKAQLALKEHAGLDQLLRQQIQDLAQRRQEQLNQQQQEQARQAQVKSQLQTLTNTIMTKGQEIQLANQLATSHTMADMSRQHAQRGTELQNLQRSIMEVEVRLAQVVQIPEPTCPTCGQELGEEWRQDQQAQEQALKEAKAQLETQLRACTQAFREVEALLVRVREAGNKREWLARELEQLKTQHLLLQDELKPREAQVMDSLIRELEMRILQGQARIATLEQEASGELMRAEGLEKVAKAFKTMPRDLLFDEIRGKLEEWTHHYLQELVDTDIRVQYPVDTVKDKFEIWVWNGPHKQELFLFSGGEKWRISFAIMLALRMVLGLDRSCNLDLLLVDDPIGKLDKAGTWEFSHLLSRVAGNSVPHVLVTVPKEEALEVQAHILEVTKQRGVATCRYI